MADHESGFLGYRRRGLRSLALDAVTHAVTQRAENALNVGGLALNLHDDAAVRIVADPPCHGPTSGEGPGGGTESHSLNPAFKANADSVHGRLTAVAEWAGV
jgi:hypothetical protein